MFVRLHDLSVGWMKYIYDLSGVGCGARSRNTFKPLQLLRRNEYTIKQYFTVDQSVFIMSPSTSALL